MFEVIDFIVAPLTELNPIKYVFSRSYRSRKRHELGVRAHRILVYWCFLLTVAATLIVFFWMGVE